jgi:hypothetical protein
MYDAKVVATFECVELELQTQFTPIKNVTIGGFTRDEKSTKRIIGDMSHTYFVTFLNYDDLADVKKFEEVVAGLEKTFPDLHFRVTVSKSNVGAIQGAYLRVGATPPTDVSLAAEAIDEILGENSEA